MEDKIDFIDEFLARCEDWMHGEDGDDVTICRVYLSELQEKVKNCSIPDVSHQRELLAAFQKDYNKRNFEDSQIADQDIELFLAANCT